MRKSKKFCRAAAFIALSGIVLGAFSGCKEKVPAVEDTTAPITGVNAGIDISGIDFSAPGMIVDIYSQDNEIALVLSNADNANAAKKFHDALNDTAFTQNSSPSAGTPVYLTINFYTDKSNLNGAAGSYIIYENDTVGYSLSAMLSYATYYNAPKGTYQKVLALVNQYK